MSKDLAAEMESTLAKIGARTPPDPRKPASDKGFGLINHAPPEHGTTPGSLPMSDLMDYRGPESILAVREATRGARHFASFQDSSADIREVRGQK